MIYVLVGIIIILCILLCFYIKKAKQQIALNEQQANINKELEDTGKKLTEKNDILQQQAIEKETQLLSFKIAIKTQENILKSISETNENLRKESVKNAETAAQEAYEARIEALAANYEQKEQEYKNKYEQVISALNKNILSEKSKLDDLTAKQNAYYEAQKRAQEIAEKEDYYRLLLSEYDISDIYLLRDLQIKFTRKDMIDKMIWETYYRPAFDVLTGKILTLDKVCGIYKITSLKNQMSYIGQSVDIKERWRQHIKSGLNHGPTTNRLYQEMYKQGPESFTFEVLEQVPRDKLNERESYWIDFYKTKEIGLNTTKGNT